MREDGCVSEEGEQIVSILSYAVGRARAVELVGPGLAFTEHVDFTDWILADGRRVAPLDVEGYLADVARCRTSRCRR